MAKAKPRRCVMCGSEQGVQMWTIDTIRKVSVTYLCGDHGAPLKDIMEAAGDLPPGQQVPLPDRVAPEPEVRQRKLIPLLDWTPPD